MPSTSDWRRPTATASARRPYVSGASAAKAGNDKVVAGVAAHDKAGDAPVTALLAAKSGNNKAVGALADTKTAVLVGATVSDFEAQRSHPPSQHRGIGTLRRIQQGASARGSEPRLRSSARSLARNTLGLTSIM